MASLSSRAAGPPQVEDPGVLSRWASAATGIYSGGKLAAGAEPGGRNPKRRASRWRGNAFVLVFSPVREFFLYSQSCICEGLPPGEER